MTAYTVKGCEAFAERILSELGILEPHEIDLRTIAYMRGALVVAEEIDGSAARLVRRGPKALIVVRSDAAATPHGRFCVAHELGHLCIHRHLDQLANCTEGMIFGHGGRPEEREASAFAAGLLMPGAMFRAKAHNEPPTRDVLGQLAGVFDVSLTAAALRYGELGASLSAVVMSRGGVVAWTRPGRDFPYRLPMPGAVLDGATLALGPNGGEGITRAEAWLSQLPAGPAMYLREVSVSMPRYGQVLTVLSVLRDVPADAGSNGSGQRQVLGSASEEIPFTTREWSLSVDCPRCGAAVDERCFLQRVLSSGEDRRVSSHAERHRMAVLVAGAPRIDMFHRVHARP